MKNQNGFASISLIFILPLIFTLSFSLLWTLWFLNQQRKLENLCHEFLLEAQSKIVHTNNQIMNLNPKARWLYWEKKALLTLIATAPPPVKAAAKVRLEIVKTKQKMLLTHQKILFAKGLSLSRMELFKYKRRFYQITQQIYMFWGQSPSTSRMLSIFPAQSALKKELTDIAPTYKRDRFHTINQKISAQWRIPLKEITPLWLKEFVTVQKYWHGECQTQPQKGRIQWIATISGDNPLSRFSF